MSRTGSAKRRLCNDVRRELTWGYKDQSVRNLIEVGQSIFKYAKDHKSCKAYKTATAVASYVSTLKAMKLEGFIPENIKLKSRWLLNIVQDWETETEKGRSNTHA